MKISALIGRIGERGLDWKAQVSKHSPIADPATTLGDAQRELARILSDNLLPYWIGQLSTTAGNVAEFLAEQRDGSRRLSLVQLTRYLWFLSSLDDRVAEGEGHRELAAEAYDTLTKHFLDERNGGFFWEVDIGTGLPTKPGKHLYGQAFAIYSLAQYGRATGRQEAMSLARATFDLMEVRAHDDQSLGYHEWFECDWKANNGVGYLGYGADVKTINTHLHILEALMALHGVMPGERLRDRIIELVEILYRRALAPRYSVAFDRYHSDWRPLKGRKHRRVSYGHELECIHLSLVACEAVGQNLVDPIAYSQRRFAYCMKYGFDFQDGGFFQLGTIGSHASKKTKIWWVQAEALLSALTMYRITSQSAYLSVFERTLAWITNSQIDWDNGEWYENIDPAGQASGVKRGRWKGPYHNGRAVLASLDLIDRLLRK